MHLRALVVWLFAVNTTLASLYAAPFEGLAFYKSYLADWEANPTGSKTIAPGCYTFFTSAPNTKKPCDFDQFVDHVYGKAVGYTKQDISGLSINDAAKKIFDNGFKGLKYDLTKLLPGTPSGTHYGEVIRDIANAVQNARQKGVGGQTIQDVYDAFHGIHIERSADQYKGLMRDLKKTWLNKHGLVLNTKGKNTPLGRDNNAPDYDKALKPWKGTPMYATKLAALQTDEKTYLNNPSTKGGQHKGQIVPLVKAKKAFKGAATCLLV
ncbi:hypothetical protein JX265_006759 [Neoarthrinium moseri]|uniref:Uncharacterized protein n=1 Tax=Neoarthrinium moseri TaxID=1658444 RepID=A0A9Q0ANP0_9PEZI|nr:uncharacterized protein JN550_002769 [Neoarthrinium moseri]KAI1847048.1 hypothetical protein JX266_006923 [Neoarthrinium moseri]KAI1868780.1 hypothetical protein JX265_006759 [Neoarthrinium moseri]KAI1874190.1 hypothetical protein JN550_002769 [Neoarthrinium moseri]